MYVCICVCVHTQGVSIGDGWVRYWDDVHHANYYFHPGTWAREGRRERVINNALYALSALSYAGIFTCRIAYAMPGMPYVQSIMPPDCLCDAWYALCAVYNASCGCNNAAASSKFATPCLT